jgi:methionine sulfoxide reductase heme-binding subunit
VAGLAILHFFWMRAGKHNFAEVAAYAAIIGALLAWRLFRFWQQRGAQPRPAHRGRMQA